MLPGNGRHPGRLELIKEHPYKRFLHLLVSGVPAVRHSHKLDLVFPKALAAVVFSLASLLPNAESIAAAPFQAPLRATTPANLEQFVGKWTARRQALKLLVLELRLENGKLVGDMQTSSFTVDTEGTGEILEITDPNLTKPLPARNFSAQGKSLSFDWTDPDGDEVHWRFDLAETGAGSLHWVQLPNGLKMQPIMVRKQPKA